MAEVDSGGIIYTNPGYSCRLDQYWNTKWSYFVPPLRKMRLVEFPDGEMILAGHTRNNFQQGIMQVYKRDKNGDVIWEYLGTPEESQGAVDALMGDDGYLYILGKATSDTLFPNSPDPALPEYLISMIDPYSGLLLAQQHFQKEGFSFGSLSLEKDDNGNLYVFGKCFQDTNQFQFLSQHGGWVTQSNVHGNIYHELGNNCTLSVGDSSLPGKMVEVNGGDRYAITDLNGEFELQLPPGTHAVSQIISPYWYDPCFSGPSQVTIDTTGSGPINFFFPTAIAELNPDMRAGIVVGPTRVGFTQTHWVLYENAGTLPQSGSLRLALDDVFEYQGAVPFPDTISGDSLIWAYSNILPGEKRHIQIKTRVPVDLSLMGSTFRNFVTVSPILSDPTPTDNSHWFEGVITNSFDPNDKQVFPEEINPGGHEMQYLIRFQNTGTDTAFKIVIRDTISPQLDLTSFRMGPVSHSYTLRIQPERVLEWTFTNILLPDSTTNEPESHGLISFWMKSEPELPLNSEIHNAASIFFDFNPPVITNTVVSTVVPPIIDPPNPINNFIVYPNPTTKYISIDGEMEYLSDYNLEMVDIVGKTVLSQKGIYLKKPITLNLRGFQKGLFMIRMKIGGQEFSRKILLTK